MKSSSLSLEYALRESGCRIGYEPTRNELRLLSEVDIQGLQREGFCYEVSFKKSISLERNLGGLSLVSTEFTIVYAFKPRKFYDSKP